VPPSPHWLWSGKLIKSGYGQIRFQDKIQRVHRVAWLVFQKADTKMADHAIIRHLCRYRHCVNPEHLEPGTDADNARDKIRDGTSGRGERSPSAKISAGTALQIKQSKGNGTATQRAERFGTSVPIVWNIDRGATWKHLEDKK